MGGRRSAALAAALALAGLAGGAEAGERDRPYTRPVTIAKGGGDQGAWELFARRTRRGELCIGLLNAASRGEDCAPPPGKRDRIALGTSAGCRTGTFVYGFVSRRAVRVRVRYADGSLRRARVYRSPRRLDFDGRFYLARRARPLGVKGVRAVGAKGRLLQSVTLSQPPVEGCG